MTGSHHKLTYFLCVDNKLRDCGINMKKKKHKLNPQNAILLEPIYIIPCLIFIKALLTRQHVFFNKLHF